MGVSNRENAMRSIFVRFAGPLVGAGLLAASASSMAQTLPARVADGVFVGPNGMTLYTFDRDVMGAGKSACNGPCATNWPPLMAASADAGSGEWTVVSREDGSRQWAYRGKPVYFWARDAKPGDRTGDGFNNAWHLARP
jgi:predicted lipoprotein with Yx(FWY)xxD motif